VRQRIRSRRTGEDPQAAREINLAAPDARWSASARLTDSILSNGKIAFDPQRTSAWLASGQLRFHVLGGINRFWNFPMRALFICIDTVLEIYCWILVVFTVLQLFSGFKVIDIRNRPTAVINTWLDKATALPLWPVRKILPDLGDVDLSPIILILMLMTVRYVIALNAWPQFF
jgi:YggT family protein